MPMAIGFIFMATRADRTVPQARALIEEALALGVANIGFKDVGLPPAALKELARAIHAGGGARVLRSRLARSRQRNRLGRRRRPISASTGCSAASARAKSRRSPGRRPRYAPFPGEFVGHPSALVGRSRRSSPSAERSARSKASPGSICWPIGAPATSAALMRAVVGAVDKPVIVAGSIDDAARVSRGPASGAAGFTVGSAAIEARLRRRARLRAQIRAIQSAVAMAA